MKVLVVVDMQKDFIDGSLGTKEAVAIVDNVKAKIKEFDGKVIYTRDTHPENYLETNEGKHLPVKHCIENSFGWNLYAGIVNVTKDFITINKPTFGSVELGKTLVEWNEKESIESITLIGLCTDICVISNALLAKAFLPEVDIYVDAKCCAGVTRESHDNALKAMAMCQIEILNWNKDKDVLSGVWTGKDDFYGDVTWTFDNGYCNWSYKCGEVTGSFDGQYTIEDGKALIKLNAWDEPKTYEFNITKASLSLKDSADLAPSYELTK